ncbi:MAG: hypothetical protein PHS93_08970 [Candidatus Omnitrophica bacterium]|jgi:hypothetical protein|nr:hypothetical protein [Candidatus Omnitrophota bacterium]
MIIEEKDISILWMLADVLNSDKHTHDDLRILLEQTTIFHYLAAAKIINNDLKTPDLQEIFDKLNKVTEVKHEENIIISKTEK